MSSPIPPILTLINPDGTKWALLAHLPASILEVARHELSDFLRNEGSRVVSGNKGMSALLVFGGSLGEGEDLAVELARKHKTPVYLLDFDDDEPGVGKVDGKRVKWKRDHPADLLESHGIIAPGYEPQPERVDTISVIGVVDDVTPEQARRALPKAKGTFTVNARGVLVNEDYCETLHLAQKLKRQCFELFYDRADGSFSCIVRRPGEEEECFDPTGQSVNYKPIDSVLGETTFEGILRVLDIPRHMLPSVQAPATNSSPSPK